MKKKLPLIIIISIAIAAIAGLVIFIVSQFSSDKKPNDTKTAAKDNITKVEPAESDDKFELEELDVKAYFEERAEIISVIPVQESTKTLSEKDVTNEFNARGFTDYTITSNYSFDGRFSDAINVSEESNDKHPMYQTYYVTSKNELWVISEIEGNITAYPSSYNITHANSVPLILSESKEIASYDSSSNSIYVTIPKDNSMLVRVIDHIDSDILETIDLEG